MRISVSHALHLEVPLEEKELVELLIIPELHLFVSQVQQFSSWPIEEQVCIFYQH